MPKPSPRRLPFRLPFALPSRFFLFLLLLLPPLLLLLHASRSFYHSVVCPVSLSRLLNIPSFHNRTLPLTPATCLHHAARFSPLLAFYLASDHPTCTLRPSATRLRAALAQHTAALPPTVPPTLTPTLQLVRRPDVLVVQFTEPVSPAYVKEAVARANDFAVIVLLPTDLQPRSRQVAAERVATLLRAAHDVLDVRMIVDQAAAEDDHLALAASASHLLLDGSPFAGLAALVAEGTLLHSAAMDKYMRENSFKWMLKNGTFPAWGDPEPPRRALLYGMGRVAETCCTFEAFGAGDGQKVLCRNARSIVSTAASPGCWVLSVGCNGKWSFEQDIVNKTSCQVHTFDCTGTWPVPPDIKKRVTLHKLCLGVDGDPNPDFRGWNELIGLGSKLSGLGEARMPSVAKMDIEGFEFPVLTALVADGSDELLPEQIAVEVHSNTGRPVGPPYIRAPSNQTNMVSKETIGDLFKNLSTRGYKLVHRADNPFCPHCSEVTLLRDVGLPEVH